MINIDASAAAPLHRQIYQAWRDGILAGRFHRGQRLPSSRELAVTLGVARTTVSQAYEQLAAEGYLRTAQGSGTFVAADIPDDLPALGMPAAQAAASPAIRLSRFGVRLREDFVYAPGALDQSAGQISFAQLTPDLQAFPFPLWQRLLNRQMRGAERSLFDYARAPNGHEPLRTEIAAYLARSRAVRCSPDQVVVLSGSQQALDFAARLLLEPGDPVAFEEPGYLGTRRVFEAHGARLLPVPLDREGLDVLALESAVAATGSRGLSPRLIYVTPSHQFPSGISMSLTRRLALLEWAGRHGSVILEDDYDSEFRFSGPPLPALQGLVAEAPVIYCGSFSKVMFPGLRIGYAVVPPSLVPAFRRLKWVSDRHSAALEQAALTDFLAEGHLERHIRRMRRIYGERRRVLVAALQANFGDAVTVSGDPAGLHVMARFQDAGVGRRAARNGVYLVDAAAYHLGDAPPNAYLLGFSALDQDTIREGVRRLAP